MGLRVTKRGIRRQQVREQRAKVHGTLWTRLARRIASWPACAGLVFVAAAVFIALIGEGTFSYFVQQPLDQAVYAEVDFQVQNEQQTKADRQAAMASTPSYYSFNAPALTFDRIRADLMRLYQAGADSETLEDFNRTLVELKTLEDFNRPAGPVVYARLRAMADETGRAQFQAWVNELPLEKEYVVRDLLHERRNPQSTTGFIRLDTPIADGLSEIVEVPITQLVLHGNERAVRGAASAVAQKFKIRELEPVVEAVVLAAFRDQPTITYNEERTLAEMDNAEKATPEAWTTYEKGKVIAQPGVLRTDEYELLRAHHDAYLKFLKSDLPEAEKERRALLLRRSGFAALVALLCLGLLTYTGMHQPRVFTSYSRTLAFAVLMLGALLAARVLKIRWPQLPELVFAPCLAAATILAIAYPRRFAMGAMFIAAMLVSLVVNKNIVFLLTLFTGVAVAIIQLDEIRTRFKLPAAGAVTALAMAVASAAGGFSEGHSLAFIAQHAACAGGSALAAAFAVSGLLPAIEQLFGIATSLTLLEWRDPTRPLLQLLAREAPGTYNHSLLLGTLAEAACESIGANGLLAQVGALYHDIGKITKSGYFTENQGGRISRHENLAPTMSLLIIIGHVKDGIEMAKEYKLPSVLRQFIEEHHGTTVVRYFHFMASEKQPLIASGKHDREVPEAEFRYGGPKPQSRESAVLMLCDGVEGAVRALPEPTPGRIESAVHQVFMDRLNDGQFDDCEITLKELRRVEESLVKSLCAVYHGRVAYPKARKPSTDEAAEPRRVNSDAAVG